MLIALAGCQKTRLQAAQKDLRGEAREKSTSGGVRGEYVVARRLSATKHMSLFQQPASGRSETRCYSVRRTNCATPDALDGSSSAPRVVNHARLPLCPGPARESSPPARH